MSSNDLVASRATWKGEIDEWIEQLKMTERDLGAKEKELQRREMILRQHEQKLEEQFHVVQLESYDVNMWRDVDVQQWVLQLGHNGHRDGSSDLIEISKLFMCNAITGKRLLLLTLDNLYEMGIQSIGHAVEIYNEIQTLKAHNYRLQNFPPLSVTNQLPFHSETYSVTVTLMVGCHVRRGSTLEESRWKLYFELDAGDNCDLVAREAVRHVTLDSPRLPGNSLKLTQPHFIMERWITGITQDIIIDCLVVYEERVRRPRSSTLVHHIDVNNLHATTQISVPLMVQRHESCRNSPARSSQMTHSVSTPLLQGVWNMRSLQHAVPPLDLSCHAVESVWSGVVSGTQSAALPAHQPSFQPVPLLHSASYVDVRSSTPKHSHQMSLMSSSNHLSREHTETGFTCGSRHSSPAGRGSDSSLQREESSDSGGVFLTPTSASHTAPNLESQTTIVGGNSGTSSAGLPLTSLVSVGRKFGRLSDNSDLECRGKDLSDTFSYQNSAGIDLLSVSKASVHPHEFIDSPEAFHSRRNSCSVCYHCSNDQFIEPAKSKKKTKKSKQKQVGQAGCSSAKSVMVYGGNPKWIWKS